jgi:hypothetical protein
MRRRSGPQARAADNDRPDEHLIALTFQRPIPIVVRASTLLTSDGTNVLDLMRFEIEQPTHFGRHQPLFFIDVEPLPRTV